MAVDLFDDLLTFFFFFFIYIALSYETANFS